MDISLAINPFMHPIVGAGGASWTSGGVTCSDTEAAATDSGGENCSWYFTSPATCAGSNNVLGTFNAGNMCCRCGGGESTPGSSVCTSLDIQAGVAAKTDSQSNACSWYVANPLSCGLFDDTDFIASELCCSCAGTYVDSSGVSDGRCIDGDTSG